MTMVTASQPTTPVAANSETPWHALSVQDVLENLEATPEGLTTDQIASRQQTYGKNILPTEKPDGWPAILFRQINNPLIYILLASSALAFFMSDPIDGIVVLGVVVINALIGFIQEHRASRALAAIKNLVSIHAAVVRDGARKALPAAELVPGDIVLIEAGDKVPADLRLIAAKNLSIGEALLTGESVPSAKRIDPVAADAVIAERFCLAYSGTLVTSGSARGVVIATGERTALGKIGEMLRSTSKVETPLTRSIDKFSHVLTWTIALIAVGLCGLAFIKGYSVANAVLAAITLAVAAIPEGLPAIITIALAIGVRRMAQRQAIIRSLPAVETLGSTTVICTDKTGTLTKNEMTVQALWTPGDQEMELTGVGYRPEGALLREGKSFSAAPSTVVDLVTAAALCNDAHLTQKDGLWRIEGDPTEGALLTAAYKVGVDLDAARKALPRIDAIPFESQNQYMVTLHRSADGACCVYVKGAPERILHFCKSPHADVSQVIEGFARRGMRVLGVAKKLVDGSCQQLTPAIFESGCSFLGLEAMIDPPRDEAIAAISACKNAGIQVKMITGDHLVTAAAIGKLIGIREEGDPAAGGGDIEQMIATNSTSVEETTVFARVAPEHKLQLVRALQKRGEVVAMTGDGVNDAPALKQADIGVAMGITGTAVSQDAADVVLTDDNFASIVAAIEEGRRVYDNLTKSLAFVLPTNIGEALILLLAVAFFPVVMIGHAGESLPLLPMSPVQILWINLVATVSLALPLAFEAKEPGLMNRTPRRPGEPILNRFVVVRTILVASIMAAAGLGIFWLQLFGFAGMGNIDESIVSRIPKAQTAAVTAVIFMQVFYLINCRSLKESVLKIGVFTNPAVFVGIGAILTLQLLFVYAPFMNRLFGSAPIGTEAWLKALLAGAVIVPVIAIEKFVRSRQEKT